MKRDLLDTCSASQHLRNRRVCTTAGGLIHEDGYQRGEAVIFGILTTRNPVNIEGIVGLGKVMSMRVDQLSIQVVIV
ncbi:MAG: hypothetical protein RQ866_08560 [Bacteroidales bacterium]|nr:hypothetical protein [Bacteroidales bacterium]